MKIGNILSSVATAAALAFPGAVAEPQKALSVVGEQRELSSFTPIWEECVGTHLTVCQGIINAEVASNPGLFNNLSQLNFEVLSVRAQESEDYYNVGLRTNKEETHVDGILGDGMIWYPWQWCETETCYDIGPWDCDVGTPLTVEQCCTMIKDTVPNADRNGNYIECHVDPPIGSVSNPVDRSRVCIHVNSDNIVVHPPRNE